MEKLLIIGGPNFIGRVLLEQLERLGRYEVTMFNRGLTNPELFPQVRRIKGDRNTADVVQLANEKWDYVVDVACFLPGNFTNLLASINQDVKNYVFISTVSVYEEQEGSGYDETAPTLAYDPATDVDQPINSAALYGPRKAECERMLQSSGLKHTILRPAIIYGDYDRTDRTAYWLYQARKKDVLFIPETGQNRVSHTYVRDLAKSILQLLSPQPGSETYNSITTSFSISELVDLGKQTTQRNPAVLQAPKAFLDAEGLNYWSDLPLWLPNNAVWDNHKYQAKFGHRFTDIPQSIAETVAYYESIGWPEPTHRKVKDERYDELTARLMSV